MIKLLNQLINSQFIKYSQIQQNLHTQKPQTILQLITAHSLTQTNKIYSSLIMQEFKEVKPLEDLTIDQIFQIKQLAVFQMFTIPQIHKRLKSNIKKFSQYLQNNQNFFYQMINLGIKIPFHQSNDQKKKEACYIATDILTQGYQCIANLFIKQEEMEQILQEQQGYQSMIQNQATGQIIIQEIQFQQKNHEQERFKRRFKFLIQLLNYLNCTQINESCLNYMCIVLQSIIKKDSQIIMDFFSIKKNYLDKLLQLAYYPSVSQMLVKMISDQDKTKDYQYKPFKAKMIQTVGDYMRKHINDDWYFQGYLEFIVTIFQATKSTYMENVDDFKDIADGLVSENYIKFFIDAIDTIKQQNIIGNCLLFLNKLIRRRNYDQQMDQYDKQNFPLGDHKKQPTKTMNFQFNILYEYMQRFINVYSRKVDEYSNLTRMTFYQDLYLLTKHSQFQTKITQLKINNLNILYSLLTSLSKEKTQGLIKFYIQVLFERFIKITKISPNQLSSLVKSIKQQFNLDIQHDFIIKQKQQPRVLNKDQNKPFIKKLLILIQNKKQELQSENQLIQIKSDNFKSNGLNQLDFNINLQLTRKIYNTKLNDLSPSKHKDKFFGFIKNPNGKQLTSPKLKKENSPLIKKQYGIQDDDLQLISPTKRSNLNLNAFDQRIKERKRQSKQAKLKQQKQNSDKNKNKQNHIISKEENGQMDQQQQKELLSQINGIIVRKVESQQQHIQMQVEVQIQQVENVGQQQINMKKNMNMKIHEVQMSKSEQNKQQNKQLQIRQKMQIQQDTQDKNQYEKIQEKERIQEKIEEQQKKLIDAKIKEQLKIEQSIQSQQNAQNIQDNKQGNQ